ncbi:hypothetical protein HYPGJ_31827 [Hyphomicrobium sp. GJ21]|nr:hypothetical protein HYPGJ_31827 [Hyphomicrobium sp. GJ21]
MKGHSSIGLKVARRRKVAFERSQHKLAITPATALGFHGSKFFPIAGSYSRWSVVFQDSGNGFARIAERGTNATLFNSDFRNWIL